MFDEHPRLLRAWRTFCCLIGAAFVIWRGYAFEPQSMDDLLAPAMCFMAGLVLLASAAAILFQRADGDEAVTV
jgi:hypothetical protein